VIGFLIVLEIFLILEKGTLKRFRKGVHENKELYRRVRYENKSYRTSIK